MKISKMDKVFMIAIIDRIPAENINRTLIFENKFVKIYNAYLYKLLTTDRFAASVLNINVNASVLNEAVTEAMGFKASEEIIINGTDFQKDYVKGYYEGREHFDSLFPQDEFLRDPKAYIGDIKHNYYNAKLPNHAIIPGWRVGEYTGPITYFNHASISDNGFQAGILSRIEDLKGIRPSLFSSFKDTGSGNKDKSFHELLNLTEKRDEFMYELKNEFCNEKSIGIRYMIEGLNNKKLLITSKGGNSELYRGLKIYFKQNIGTYNSIFVTPDLNVADQNNPGTLGEYHKKCITIAEKRIANICKKLKIE